MLSESRGPVEKKIVIAIYSPAKLFIKHIFSIGLESFIAHHLEFTVSSGALIIVLALIFATVPHMFGTITVYIQVCTPGHIYMCWCVQDRGPFFKLLFIFYLTLSLSQGVTSTHMIALGR